MNQDDVARLRIKARTNAWHKDGCPYCGERRVHHDRPARFPKVWRGLDFGGAIVEIEYRTHRIPRPAHGVATAAVPWAYPGSGFTRNFDLTVAWLAAYLPRSAVSSYARIGWETVGDGISRSPHDLGPERSKRLDGLVNIGIDETSCRKGHKRIAVVVNHDANTVVWVSDGHGKAVLERFYRPLAEEQPSSIKVVTGDGARWIAGCVNEFTPDRERRIDSFHVVEWAMDALDEVRKGRRHAAYADARAVQAADPRKPGGPKLHDESHATVQAAKQAAADVRGSAYALGKAPERLAEARQIRLEMIQATDPQPYRAYRLKESLRLPLKMSGVEQAEAELRHWPWRASHGRIPAFKELYVKIKRHKEHILNTIRPGMGNARIEAASNKIKLIIRKAYGFRSIQNMMDMVYPVCSNIRIPLPNRKLPAGN